MPTNFGQWPRGAGRASFTNGQASSLPDQIRQSSVEGSIVRSAMYEFLYSTPYAVNHS